MSSRLSDFDKASSRPLRHTRPRRVGSDSRRLSAAPPLQNEPEACLLRRSAISLQRRYGTRHHVGQRTALLARTRQHGMASGPFSASSDLRALKLTPHVRQQGRGMVKNVRRVLI